MKSLQAQRREPRGLSCVDFCITYDRPPGFGSFQGVFAQNRIGNSWALQ
jgi:hypothetical protein